MNTPNRLTVLRLIFTPVFLVFMLAQFPHHYALALIVFIGASVTDLLDGKIARKYNLITNFGKFLDPIADKLLTTAAFLAFIAFNMGYGIVWATFIVLAREFIVTSMRLLAAADGKVVAANFWGKLKTVSQIVAIIATIFFEYIISEGVYHYQLLSTSFVLPLRIIYSVCIWVSAIFALISGVKYVADNKQYIDIKK
ncbi:MAG: CDP-diacylglycerol--glycerol-3-phosphate 3-phosphatidyltransferase [Clostridia bacterium]|nr:CDP-diacylglycerol--glycerol-3-phosphate 3-phosphatidyltransferase [Clostridia bacterium]